MSIFAVIFLENSLTLPLFGIGMKTDLFQSYGHCWVFQIFWHIECNTLTASSFITLNSSAGIPAPPLAFFIAMLLKAHLTSQSRMSGSRWVTTPLWLPGWLWPFLYSLLCNLATSYSLLLLLDPFLFFIMPILAWNIPLISPIFLKSFLVFPILLFSSISLHC